VSFVGVRTPDGATGYDLWVGGGLSTNPMIAQRLGAFVEADRVPAVWRGVTELFRDYGYRRLRSRARLKFLVADWGAERFQEVLADPSVFRRGTIACTGIEFCKLAIVETKVRAVDLYGELERRLPDFDTPITINVNGCPNACARFQLADIGLKGSIVDGGEGFQVHLGGSLGADQSFGRKLRGLKVTSARLTDYVERILRNYSDDRTDGETFATWVRRADEALLQ